MQHKNDGRYIHDMVPEAMALEKFNGASGRSGGRQVTDFWAMVGPVYFGVIFVLLLVVFAFAMTVRKTREPVAPRPDRIVRPSVPEPQEFTKTVRTIPIMRADPPPTEVVPPPARVVLPPRVAPSLPAAVVQTVEPPVAEPPRRKGMRKRESRRSGGDICARHRMQKVMTRGGRSWRCKRGGK